MSRQTKVGDDIILTCPGCDFRPVRFSWMRACPVCDRDLCLVCLGCSEEEFRTGKAVVCASCREQQQAAARATPPAEIRGAA